MKCPKCNNEETKVLEKRRTPGADSIRRRRECLGCGNRFTTYEKHEGIPLIVIKKNGEKEPFIKEKFISGILKAVEKRPVDITQVENLYKNVVEKLQEIAVNNEVHSNTIGDLIASKLKDLDKVAYIRFASVYKSFKNMDSFERELERLKSDQ